MAARFNCPKVVELLLNDRRVVIDAKTVDGLTALHLVAEGREDLDSNPQIIRSQEDRCNVVRMLLEAEKQRRSSNVDCHLNQSDVLKRFPIHYGVECDSAEVVKELLKWTDTPINAQDIYGLTPLHLATRSKANNREAIVALLFDVHNININIKSVMSSAIEQSPFRMAKVFEGSDLFAIRSNVFLPFLPVQPLEQDGIDSNHIHALHFAAQRGSAQIVDSFLQRPEITINVQDDKGFTPLHLAAQQGHVEVVERLLQFKGPSQLALVDGAANTSVHLTSESGHTKEEMLLELAANEVNINGTNNDGNTPLHLASEEGHVEMVQVLLGHISKSGFNWKNNDGNTPLHLATNSGHAEVVKLFLEQTTFKLIFNGEDNNIGNTLIHHATKNGDVEVVKVLLQQTTFTLNLNEENADGDTPLHLACGEGHDKVVQFLLENVRGLNINAKNDDENTPLHLAIDNGNVEVVKVLLGFVAIELNFNRENDGNKALQLASKEGHVSKLHFNEKNGDQDTPLHLASRHGHVEVVNMLLDVCGASKLKLNGKNGDENTPLHLAADEGHVGVVNLLLKHASLDFQGRRDVQNHDTKPNLAEKNGDGNTPLHLASKEGHEEVVHAILLSECVNKSILNAINEDGNTPLHLAIKNGHANVVTKMLEDASSKFDLNVKNKNGHTPLHFATRKCHLHVVKALCLMGQQLRANVEDGSGKTCLQYAKDQQDDNIKLEEIANILMERSDVKDFLDRQYRDRQVFIDAANALLVGGALIAGITFASWLQPPLGYITYYQFHQSSPGTPANTFEAFAGLEMHYTLRLFWVFNTLSFFFAIGTVISGAKAALPDLDTVFIVESLRYVRKELQWTSILLVCAIVTVLGSFVCAGFAILPPIQRDVRNMKISVIIGLVICSWTIFKFLMKLFKTMAKVIKQTKATSRKQQTKDENLWVWLLQSVKFMHRPREDEDDEMEEEAATRLDTKMGSHLLVKTSNKSLQCVEYIGEGVSSYDVGAIQGNGPARHPRRRYYYFEITIKDCGLNGCIGIGFTDEDFKNNRQPGWESNSYSYHGDDGNLFHEPWMPGIEFGPTFSTNDIVGAGIDHLKQKIFFTKNGKLVGRYIPNEVRDTLYPTIGLHSRGEKVEVNFGTKKEQKFAYNLDLNAKL
jgi:serine/threonine-protein phosphatase 6 regulatory ankyrin repeat subunit B